MAHDVKRDRFYCCCSDFALKLVDGGMGETPTGAFTLSLVQVDENGTSIEGGFIILTCVIAEG